MAWAKHLKRPAGASSGGVFLTAIDNDNLGNLYVVGYVAGGNINLENNIISSNGRTGDNIFYAKYNADGSLAFAHIVGGNADDRATDITVDTDGSFYIVGSSGGGPGFFNPENSNPTDPICNNPSICGFSYLLKYNAGGSFAWAKETHRNNPSANQLNNFAVKVTSDGVYVTGQGLSIQKFNKNDGNLIWKNNTCGT
ncbi:MAG: hypothetical protein ACK40K_00105, partial [Raineya sp.]